MPDNGEHVAHDHLILGVAWSADEPDERVASSFELPNGDVLSTSQAHGALQRREVLTSRVVAVAQIRDQMPVSLKSLARVLTRGDKPHCHSVKSRRATATSFRNLAY